MSDLFPRLPVLEDLEARASPDLGSELSRRTFVCCQHLLETTGSLFESLFRLGLNPANTKILGKVYSSNTGVADRLRRLGAEVVEGSAPLRPGQYRAAIRGDALDLWDRTPERPSRPIILLDDGGHLIRSMPGWAGRAASTRSLVAVEQTASGVNLRRGGVLNSEVVSVAQSAAKRELESPLIADAIADRLVAQLSDVCNLATGVVGYGAIGRSVAERVGRVGTLVGVYDPNRVVPSSVRADQIADLLERCDIVIGCAGEPSVRPEDIRPSTRGRLVFASASSGDVEFEKLLTLPCPSLVRRTDPLTEIDFEPIESLRRPIRVLSHGFPVNFDNTPESVPSDLIQMTRGLLFAGVCQAIATGGSVRDGSSGGGYPPQRLDPVAQRRIVGVWRMAARGIPSKADEFSSVKKFSSASKGASVPAIWTKTRSLMGLGVDRAPGDQVS